MQTPDPTSKLTRKESYKAQRKNYRREKKRVTNELLNSLKDPSVVVLADWLKIRGTLKSWTKLWCVLKPGLLVLYKSPKAKVSSILLKSWYPSFEIIYFRAVIGLGQYCLIHAK